MVTRLLNHSTAGVSVMNPVTHREQKESGSVLATWAPWPGPLLRCELGIGAGESRSLVLLVKLEATYACREISYLMHLGGLLVGWLMFNFS